MKKFKKDKLLIPFIIVLVGTILMVSTIFMPYATATVEQAEKINEYPNELVYKELNITAKQMKNISMIEYTNLYSKLSEQIWGNTSYGIFYVTLVALIGGFSLISMLFSFFKKPIAIIVFDILAFCVFYIQNCDYTERGIIPSSSYNWGAAYYIFYVAAIVVLVGAVWMLVNKIRIKKHLKVTKSV